MPTLTKEKLAKEIVNDLIGDIDYGDSRNNEEWRKKVEEDATYFISMKLGFFISSREQKLIERVIEVLEKIKPDKDEQLSFKLGFREALTQATIKIKELK